PYKTLLSTPPPSLSLHPQPPHYHPFSSPLLSSPAYSPLTAYRAASVSAAARLGSGGSAADSAGIRLRLFTAASEPGQLVYTASCGGGGAELRFAKFERRRLQECFDFVRAQGLVPPHRFPSVASPPWRRSGGTRLWHGHLLPPPPLRAAAGST
uniref:Uncharacterized protein n=1 Tax=Oryza rufipogon TaxID=4529 RepID=A0A0E0R7F2_ORYRU